MSIKEEVMNWLEGYDEEDREAALSDLMTHGCINGLVSDLVYHVDTLAFFQKHKDEINKLVYEFGEELGLSVVEGIPGWDKEDPLCLNTNNQNLMSWFAFEEVARKVYEK